MALFCEELISAIAIDAHCGSANKEVWRRAKVCKALGGLHTAAEDLASFLRGPATYKWFPREVDNCIDLGKSIIRKIPRKRNNGMSLRGKTPRQGRANKTGTSRKEYSHSFRQELPQWQFEDPHFPQQPPPPQQRRQKQNRQKRPDSPIRT